MDQNLEQTLIEKTLEKGGTRHKYQYIMLILTLIIWINIELIAISFPYLEKQPEVSYIDPVTHENITTQLNYTICDTIQNYEYVKVYGHSWVSEFGIECNQFEVSLIGTLLFAGSAVGKILLLILLIKYLI